MGMAPGATNISVFTLKRRLDELPRNRKILLYCHSGGAAGKAKQCWMPWDSRRSTAAATRTS